MRWDEVGRMNVSADGSLAELPSASWPRMVGIRRATRPELEGEIALRITCGLYAVSWRAGLTCRPDDVLEWVVLTPVASKDFMDMSEAVRSACDVFDQKTLEQVPDTVLGRATALVDGVLRGWFRREQK